MHTGVDTPELARTSRQRRAAALFNNFEVDYRRYQYAVVEFFVDHLTDVSRSYGCDFEQVMILAIIGQRAIGVAREMDVQDMPGPEAIAMTASRLADVTGIPRETVRRKLAQMQRKGWVDKAPHGEWFLRVDEDGSGPPARRDNAALDLRGRWRVARLVAQLEGLGHQPGT